MTLNCDLGLPQAREAWEKERTDQSAADYLESLEEYWRYDFITDKDYAKALREIADYLDSKTDSPP